MIICSKLLLTFHDLYIIYSKGSQAKCFEFQVIIFSNSAYLVVMFIQNNLCNLFQNFDIKHLKARNASSGYNADTLPICTLRSAQVIVFVSHSLYRVCSAPLHLCLLVCFLGVHYGYTHLTSIYLKMSGSDGISESENITNSGKSTETCQKVKSKKSKMQVILKCFPSFRTLYCTKHIQ